jgi:hypothetical protein
MQHWASVEEIWETAFQDRARDCMGESGLDECHPNFVNWTTASPN